VEKHPERMQALLQAVIVFSWFKECSGFHDVKVYGEAASGDVDVAKKFLQ
jgi:hypothetical protein